MNIHEYIYKLLDSVQWFETRRKNDVENLRKFII